MLVRNLQAFFKYALPVMPVVMVLVSCNPGKKAEIKETKEVISKPVTTPRFERVNDSLGIGTSLIKYYEFMSKEGPVGDFLARIWSFYGKPETVSYDGFDYTFRDLATGIVFTAYCGSGGPAFGAHTDDEAKATLIINEFQDMLRNATLADCEIKFATDFGTQISGAKDGVPYDRLTE